MREEKPADRPENQPQPDKKVPPSGFLAPWLETDQDADKESISKGKAKKESKKSRLGKRGGLFKGLLGGDTPTPEITDQLTASDSGPEKAYERRSEVRDQSASGAATSSDDPRLIAQTADEPQDLPEPESLELPDSDNPQLSSTDDPSRPDGTYDRQIYDETTVSSHDIEQPNGYRGEMWIDHTDEDDYQPLAPLADLPVHEESAAVPSPDVVSADHSRPQPKKDRKPKDYNPYNRLTKEEADRLPKLDRRVQAMIDRPPLQLPWEVMAMGARLMKDAKAGDKPVPLTLPKQPLDEKPLLESDESLEDAYQRRSETFAPTEPNLPPDPAAVTGPEPIGQILNRSTVRPAPKKQPELPAGESELMLGPPAEDHTEADEPQEPTPEIPPRRPAPPPLTPVHAQAPSKPSFQNPALDRRSIKPITTPTPNLNIPVINPDLYRQAMLRGFAGGVLVSAVLAIIYLFG